MYGGRVLVLRPSSFVLGFAGNFEDEDETRTEFSDTF
jgi:hypothetical protein